MFDSNLALSKLIYFEGRQLWSLIQPKHSFLWNIWNIDEA